MILDSRQLAYFLAVARHGSVGRAAASLSTSQPAVSRSLKNLEKALGVPLFDRHALGMQPTLFGRALISCAETVENECNRTIDELTSLRHLGKGLIKIGLGPSLAHMLMPIAVAQMLGRHRNLRFEIIEGLGERLISALIHGEIDLAISGEIESPDNDIDISTELFFEDTIVVVAGASHPLFGRPDASIADLLDYPWTLGHQSRLWRELKKFFRNKGLPNPTISVESNSGHVMKAIVASTDFLSFLPLNLIEVEQKAGLIRPLLQEVVTWKRQLYFLRRRKGSIPHATSEFLAELRRSGGVMRR